MTALYMTIPIILGFALLGERPTAMQYGGMVMDCALNVELWNNLESTSYSADNVINNNVPIFARGLLAETVSN